MQYVRRKSNLYIRGSQLVLYIPKSEYDQEIPRSHIAYQPTAPQGGAT